MPGAAAVAPDGESGPLPFRARVVRPDGTCNLERAGCLDPYTVETIADDALRSGTRLEVTLPGNASHAGLTAVQTRLAWLGTRGIDVWVRRSRRSD